MEVGDGFEWLFGDAAGDAAHLRLGDHREPAVVVFRQLRIVGELRSAVPGPRPRAVAQKDLAEGLQPIELRPQLAGEGTEGRVLEKALAAGFGAFALGGLLIEAAHGNVPRIPEAVPQDRGQEGQLRGAQGQIERQEPPRSVQGAGPVAFQPAVMDLAAATGERVQQGALPVVEDQHRKRRPGPLGGAAARVVPFEQTILGHVDRAFRRDARLRQEPVQRFHHASLGLGALGGGIEHQEGPVGAQGVPDAVRQHLSGAQDGFVEPAGMGVGQDDEVRIRFAGIGQRRLGHVFEQGVAGRGSQRSKGGVMGHCAVTIEAPVAGSISQSPDVRVDGAF